MAFRATRAFLANNIALTRSKPFVARRIVNVQLGPHAKLHVLLASERERFDMAASYLALSFLYRLRPTPPKTSRSFRRHLRAQRAIRLLLLLRGFFDRGIVSISARFRAPRPFAHACARASIPVRTRYEPGWAPPRPAPPLSRFRVTGRVRTTRAPSVRVVVTRAAFCVYTTKCRRKAASWLLQSMTLRSHFGTCLALAGKCARKRAVPSLLFANKTQPFALARVIIIRVDYQSTRMQETEK